MESPCRLGYISLQQRVDRPNLRKDVTAPGQVGRTMIDSSSASDQKSCHGLGFESERESSVQSSAKMSLVARQLSDGLSATKCGSQNRKDVTDFHSCDPQKMSYEQGEACHLHTAPDRRGFCAEMSQNQTPCNPIRASSLSQKMSRTCRCKNVWHFKCPSAKVAEDVTGTICGEPKVQLQPDCTNPFQAEGANAFSLLMQAPRT